MDAALAPSLARLPVRGLELAVREWAGERSPAFLLVHGLASNARTWDGVARHLNDAGHRVVAVDQRGHGQSDKPDDGFSFEALTADLCALSDALGLTRADPRRSVLGRQRRPRLRGALAGADRRPRLR